MTDNVNSVGRHVVPSLALAMILLAASFASAELQRVEAVGSYGIHDSIRTRVIPRDEAIAMARWEGVSRVALEMIAEAPPPEPGQTDEEEPASDADRPIEPAARPIAPSAQRPMDATGDGLEEPSEDQLAALREALGEDVLPYMRSYRILDDRGQVPVFIQDDPDVTLEYVVVVEVLVDVDRVTDALEKAGLIAGAGATEAGEAISVELLGLSRYEALDFILKVLREQFGATHVSTLEFSRDRQILSVEGPFGPSTLSANLARLESPQLILEPIGVDLEGRRIRMMGQWFPAPEEASAQEEF